MARTRRDTEIMVGPHYEFRPNAAQLALLKAEIAAGRIIMVPTPSGDIPFVPFGVGRAVPLSFSYSGHGIVDWTMGVQVPPGMPARCVFLTMSVPEGGRILAETLRAIPFKDFLEEALVLTAIEIDSAGRAVSGPLQRAKTVDEARKAHHRIEREHRRRLRGTRTVGRVTDADLDEVARVYVANEAGGKPTAAVHAHFVAIGKPISRTTAGRWVAMAREAGKLGAALGKGAAGSHKKEEQHG